MARGKLIVLEGLDRAGKSTQCQLLVSSLQDAGVKVRYMRFPGTRNQSCIGSSCVAYNISDRTTPIGQMINAYLAGDTESEDHVIHLSFSANRWEAA